MFRTIPNFNHYEVSDDGVIKTNYGKNGKTTLKPYKDDDGYLRVFLYADNGKRKWIGVHKVVAMAFLGGDHEGLQVNHINYNREDNRVENLEWVTPKENTHHSIEHHRESAHKSPVIGVSKSGKVVEYDSMSEAAKCVGGSPSNIHRSIHTGYSHAGYVWKYKSPINCPREGR